MKVSVVVPIYNVEDYLSMCIESLLNQKFSDYEIILINDGSTDKSGEIAKDYEKKNENIKLIEIKNSGLSEARNTGLKYVEGEYVTFVDSDDFVEENYLNDLYNEISSKELDILICSFYRTSEKEKIFVNINLCAEKVYSNIDILSCILRGEVQCYAWNKIYKTSLFLENNIRYPFGKLYEDIETLVRLVMNSKRIGFINKRLYNYRIRNGSIVNKEKNDRAIVDMKYAIEQVNKLIQDNNLENQLKDELVSFNIMYVLSCLDMLSQSCNYNSKLFNSQLNNYSFNTFCNYSVIDVLRNKKIDSWKKRDFIFFKLGLLLLKNKIRDRKRV